MTERKRAMLLDLSVRYGGASARTLGLLAGLGPREAILAGLGGSPVVRLAREAGHEVRELGRHKFDPRVVPRLARIVRADGIDLIDCQNPQAKLAGALTAALTGCSLVSTLNSWYPAEHEGRPKGRLYMRLEMITRRGTDHFVAVSPEIVDGLIAGGVDRRHVSLIPNAVDVVAATSSDEGRRAEIAQRLGVPSDARIVCAVGRLVEAKGLDVLVRAFGQVAVGRPDTYCVIVGEGHLRRALEAMAGELQVADRFRWPGFLDPSMTREVVAACEVFALPSRTEGTPVALLEAAALGRPIVASAVGGIPTLLANGEEAVLVPPDDATTLAAAILELLDAPATAERLARAARKRVLDDHGRAAQLERTRAAYAAARQRRAGRFVRRGQSSKLRG